MKQNILGGVLALVVSVGAIGCADVGEGNKAATGEKVTIETNEPGIGGTYTIDTSKSTFRWVGAKVTNQHEGGFSVYDGTITVDGKDVSHVRINVETSSIWTDSEKLIGHLKSPDFFNVEKFPTAVFEASSFEPTDSAGATHMVTGNLTMLDSTKSISFPATISVDESGVRAQANFIINRQNWGITYPGAPDDLISDDVRITFDILATQEASVD